MTLHWLHFRIVVVSLVALSKDTSGFCSDCHRCSHVGMKSFHPRANIVNHRRRKEEGGGEGEEEEEGKEE